MSSFEIANFAVGAAAGALMVLAILLSSAFREILLGIVASAIFMAAFNGGASKIMAVVAQAVHDLAIHSGFCVGVVAGVLIAIAVIMTVTSRSD